ncbi:hypothetical protein BDZ45DRAFT_736109 [Acephala macrosclerotiorum]|nr:hypothetical protein BDZ45DRAFT_736109 [Acephala macrosclerotiorum]
MSELTRVGENITIPELTKHENVDDFIQRLQYRYLLTSAYDEFMAPINGILVWNNQMRLVQSMITRILQALLSALTFCNPVSIVGKASLLVDSQFLEVIPKGTELLGDEELKTRSLLDWSSVLVGGRRKMGRESMGLILVARIGMGSMVNGVNEQELVRDGGIAEPSSAENIRREDTQDEKNEEAKGENETRTN